MKQLSLWSLLHEQAGKSPTEAIIEEEIISTFSRKQRNYLFGPVIQFRSGGWPFPGTLLKLVRPARYVSILDGEDDLATELEALGYISTASLEAPLSREWAEIISGCPTESCIAGTLSLTLSRSGRCWATSSRSSWRQTSNRNYGSFNAGCERLS